MSRFSTLTAILTVVVAILALWYAGSVLMNRAWVMDQAARAGEEPGLTEIIAATMTQDRARLPAPHQVLIVLSRLADLALMPWAIISQTIPVVALAPMIVVLTNALGAGSLMVPKAIIAGYLSFFPVLVSMVKGLRSPDQMQLDLLRTYGASRSQTFWKLRLPASLPYFFASLKIAVAAALVGAIVGELPTGAIAGLGARMLIGSQFGEPMIMWAALFAAAILAALLIWGVTGIERAAVRMMGGRRA